MICHCARHPESVQELEGLQSLSKDAPTIMVIGSYPTESDQARHKLFTGASGAVLQKACESAGIKMSEVFMTTAVRCPGPKPKADALKACLPGLEAEIDRIKPKAIVAFGPLPLQALFGDRVISKARGHVKNLTVGDQEYKVLPTWDLIEMAEQDKAGNMNEIVQDLERAKTIVDGKTLTFDEMLAEMTILVPENTEELLGYLELALDQPVVSLDTETRGLDFTADQFLVTVQLGFAGDAAVVIPVHHPESNLDLEEVRASLDAFFENYQGVLVAHNGKFDQKAVASFTGRIPTLGLDTMIVHNLVTGDPSGHDLKSMVWKYAEAYGGYEAEVTPLMEEAEYDSSKVSLKILKNYGAMDVIMTFRIAEKLLDDVQVRGPQVMELSNMMADLSNVTSGMETTGIKLDWGFFADYEKRLLTQYQATVDEIYTLCDSAIAKTIEALGVDKLNLASSRQVSYLLYTQLKEKCRLKTKGGKKGEPKPSVSKAALEKAKHPVAKHLLTLAGISQQLKLYVKAYPALRHGDRIHPRYALVRFADVRGHESGTVSGRLSCSGPNIQQLPKEAKGEVRKAFIPDDNGSLILDADFSQIELCVTAMLCQDKDMIEMLNSGGDYHKFVASQILGVAIENVTKEQRDLGKTLNFALLYGAGPEKIADMAKIKVDDAKKHLGTYYARFPDIVKWKQGVEAFVVEHGYIDSMFGRRRNLPDAQDVFFGKRAGAMRQAVNHTCQSTASDICFRSIVRLSRMLAEGGYKTRLVMTVHDSIVFSVPIVEALEVTPKILEIMSNPQLDFISETGVKIRVDAKIGPNFGNLIPFAKYVEAKETLVIKGK